jgi:hypothetical protein
LKIKSWECVGRTEAKSSQRVPACWRMLTYAEYADEELKRRLRSECPHIFTFIPLLIFRFFKGHHTTLNQAISKP